MTGRTLIDTWRTLTVEELEAEVRRHNQLYFEQAQPEIPDAEYDALVRLLRERAPEAAVLDEVGAALSPVAAQLEHSVPMLSLDKAYTVDALREWAEKMSAELVATPKVDGAALSVHYDARGQLVRAATRGNGRVGEDITANVRAIAHIPQAIRVGPAEVRGEIYLPLSAFHARYADDFSSPRNLAAGALKLKDAQKTAEFGLQFWAYDVLGVDLATEQDKAQWLAEMDFAVIDARMAMDKSLQTVCDYFSEQAQHYDFETDGIVFKVNDVRVQQRFGATAHHPRFAMAYKWEGESGTTIVTDIEWSVSRSGVITPVAIIEPVALSGAMVSRISLHNVSRARDLGVHVGAEVSVVRRGGVIPYLETVTKSEKGRELVIPELCPSCERAVRAEGDFLYCSDPANCLVSTVGALKYYLDVVECDGFGPKLLQKLVTNQLVADAADLYDLQRDDLLTLERMGETLADKLLANIAAARTVSLDVFLQALGIAELARHSAKILAGFGDLDRVLQLSVEELAEMHGIGERVATQIVEGLAAQRALIEKLRARIELVAPEQHSGTGPLAGKTVLFTATLAAMTRSAAQALVEQAGGRLASSVSKKLDYLVVGSEGKAGSKLSKAEKLVAEGAALQILEEEEFFTLLS